MGYKRGLRKIYTKNIFRSVKKTKLRFFSILLMTLLGAAVFVGIISAGPNMRHAMDKPLERFNREHIAISSPLGIYPEDREIIEAHEGVELLEYQRTGDFFLNDEDHIVRLVSVTENIAQAQIEEGRLPNEVGEIALDILAQEREGYKIGQKVQITPDDEEQEDAEESGDISVDIENPVEKNTLQTEDFTIVGFVNHVQFFMPDNRGASLIGDGSVDYFALVTADSFTKSRPDQILLTVDSLQGLDTSDKKYKEHEIEEVETIQALFADRPLEIEETVKGDSLKELDQARQEVEDAWNELEDADRKLQDAKADLEAGWKEYEEGVETFRKEISDAEREITDGESDLADAYVKLEDGEKAYREGLATYQTGLQSLEEGENKLKESREILDKQWQTLRDGKKQLSEEGISRDTLPGLFQDLETAERNINQGLNEVEAGYQEIPEAYRSMPIADIETERTQLINQREELLRQEEQLRNLQNTRQELVRNLEELTQARAEIEAGLVEGMTIEDFLESEKQIAAGLQEIDQEIPDIPKAKQAIDQALEQIDTALVSLPEALENWRSLAGNLEQVEQGMAEVEASLQEAREKLETLDPETQTEEYQTLLGTITALEAERNGLEEQKGALANGILQIQDATGVSTQEALSAKISTLSTQRDELLIQREKLLTLEETRKNLLIQQESVLQAREEIERNLPSGMTLEAFLAAPDEISAGIKQIDQQVPDIPASLQQIAQGLEKIDDGIERLGTLIDGRKELDAARAELSTGQEQTRSSRAQLEEAEKALIELESGEKQLNEAEASYQEGAQEIERSRQTLAEADAELQAAQAEIAEGRQAYEDGKVALKDAREAWEEGKASGQKELDDAKEDLESGQAEYEDGLKTYQEEREEALPKLHDAEEAIAKGQAELEDIQIPSYQISGRYNDMAISTSIGNASNIEALTGIFSTVFYLIAMLVTLTTISRMVEEERTEIGTLKAIGLQERFISGKYLIYAFLSSSIGSILGIVLGYFVLMPIIYHAYTSGFYFILPTEYTYKFWHPLLAYFIGGGLTLFSAWFSVKYTFRAKAAQLMRPKPPAKGNRILAERITPLWNRLGFMAKVTLRNLTAKKSRMFMTLLGVLGSTALIVMGFGLRSSIASMVDKQYNDLRRFQILVSFDSEGDTEELMHIIEEVSSAKTGIYQSRASFQDAEGIRTDFVYNVLFDEEMYQELAPLRNRLNGERVSLSSDQVLITERFYDVIDEEKGELLAIRNQMGYTQEARLGDEVEAYVGNMMYVSPTYHREISGEEAKINSWLIRTGEDVDEAKLVNQLQALDAVMFVSTMEDASSAVDDLQSSLGIVVITLIIISALLTYVVLLNLTNLNVSERLREISTIKVLGFHNKEVTQYIYRETIILTAIGILIGFGGGKILHFMICFALSPSGILIDPYLNPWAYILSAIIVASFALVVMFLIHRQLKRIDMVEALKEPD